MKTLIIQNDPVVPAALLAEALAERRREFLIVKPEELLKQQEDFTHIITLGSRDSALDPKTQSQKEFIKDALSRGKSVLGICFGAQLVANILGFEHIKQGDLPREMGFKALDVSEQKFLVNDQRVFLAHNEGFKVPEDRLHASTDIYHQVFQEGKALGVQFHPECTKDSIQEWFKLGLLPEQLRKQIENEIQDKKYKEDLHRLLDFFYHL